MNGWYIGLSLDNYYCVKYYISTKGLGLDVNTKTFLQDDLEIPTITNKEAIQQALADIVFLYKNKSKKVSMKIFNT